MVGGNLTSFSVFALESELISPIAMGYVGPMVATRGGQGATLEYKVSGGSHLGVVCICDSRAIATLCRDGVGELPFDGGG
jgi:hypothetical protein